MGLILILRVTTQQIVETGLKPVSTVPIVKKVKIH